MIHDITQTHSEGTWHTATKLS